MQEPMLCLDGRDHIRMTMRVGLRASLTSLTSGTGGVRARESFASKREGIFCGDSRGGLIVRAASGAARFWAPRLARLGMDSAMGLKSREGICERRVLRIGDISREGLRL